MQTWQAVFLGARELSREISAFELEAFFTFSGAERQLIEQRRDPSLKLGLALQMGFLRMSGRLLDAFRIVPGNLCDTSVRSSTLRRLTSHRCGRCTGEATHSSSNNNWPARRLASEG